MALNPAISKVRSMSKFKLAGEHSLTMGEAVCFFAVVAFAYPSVKSKIPIIKNVGSMGLTVSLFMLFLFLWMD